MMNEAKATAFAHDWIAAWNSHDLDAIVSHYADELEFISPLIVERYDDPEGTLRTRDQLRAYFGIGLKNNPNLRFSFKQVLMGVRGFTLLYENARGGQTAEYFEHNEKGQVIRAICCYSTPA